MERFRVHFLTGTGFFFGAIKIK